MAISQLRQLIRPEPPRITTRLPIGLGDKALKLLKSATSWYDAKDISSSTQQTLPNRNGAGTAQRGSTAGSDTNDPVFLPHTGEDYVWLPPVTGNSVHSSTGALGLGSSFSIHYDFEYQTSVATGYLISQFHEADANRSWMIRQVSSSSIQFNCSDDGTDEEFATWTAAEHGMTAGGRYAIEVAFDNGDVSLFVDTVLISTKSLATATSVHNSTADVVVGGFRNGGTGGPPMNHKVYGARVETGGSDVATFDPSDLTGWTVNRSTTGLKTAVVTRPVPVFDGVDDYIQLPASDTPTFTATTGKHTIVWCGRVFDDSVTAWIYGSNSTGNGLSLFLTGGELPRLRVGGSSGFVTASSGVTVKDEMVVMAAVVDNGSATLYVTGQSPLSLDFSGVGTITHIDPRLGSTANLVNFNAPMEGFSLLSFPGEALTEEELDAIAAKLIAGSYQ